VFRIVTIAPWYTGKKKIREKLEVTILADHITALDKGLESKLADACGELRSLAAFAERGLEIISRPI
jgi:hypothetical protein